MSCSDCINRRGFLAKSALAAATLVAAEACGDGQIGPPFRSATSVGGAVTVKISDFPGLANVGTVVDIGNERAVVRTGATTFHGLSRICTHEGCDVDVRNNRFECPCHGSIFAADGSVIRGPSVASAPIGPLATLNVTFDATAGTITVG
jgi:Rieske Fe-S protein